MWLNLMWWNLIDDGPAMADPCQEVIIVGNYCHYYNYGHYYNHRQYHNYRATITTIARQL